MIKGDIISYQERYYFFSKEIVEYMHNEIVSEQTEKDSIIPFSLTKQIRDF